jgi:Domain of unknown function (DUF4332)
MALVLSLLRASKARGTHHHLALDALDVMSASSAWRRLFYKHIGTYLDGAKAPDTAFKDFKNHVLHPRDGFWGGAPERAEVWYGECVAALVKKDWPAATYAAGVLTHYCSDPCMPLHTHQTAAESNIHAALEWTVSTSYARLIALSETLPNTPRAALSVGPRWLTDLMYAAATEATQHYETLLAHYDFKRGVVAPEEGLDLVGQRAAASMLRYARHLVAGVLDRAIAEAAVTPDEVNLASDAVRAFISWPISKRRKNKDFAQDRRLIEAMYDELMATGLVDKTLRDDERQIQALYQAEVLDARLSATTTLAQSVPTATGTRSSTVQTEPTLPRVAAEGSTEIPVPGPATGPAPEPEADDPNADAAEASDGTIVRGKRVAIETPRPAPRRIEAPEARTYAEVRADPTLEPTAANVAVSDADDAAGTARPAPAAALPMAFASVQPIAIPAPPPVTGASSLSTYRPADRATNTSRLSPDSDVVDAPSIGPKTAARLNAIGIDTVSDFLKAHPIALASRLEASHLSPDVLTAWQEQARLMLRLPDMRAMHAQILVGAGYKTVEAIAAADPSVLCADVLHHALSPDGQRLLREGRAPDMEQIVALAAQAREVKAA